MACPQCMFVVIQSLSCDKYLPMFTAHLSCQSFLLGSGGGVMRLRVNLNQQTINIILCLHCLGTGSYFLTELNLDHHFIF